MPVYRIVEVCSQSLHYEIEAASEEEAVRLVEDGEIDLEPVDIGELVFIEAYSLGELDE